MPKVETESVSKDYIANVTQADLESKKKLLYRLTDAGRQLGHPKGHVFAVVGQTEYTQSLRRQLEDAYYEYEKSMDSLQKATAEFTETTGGEQPVSATQWNELLDYADCIFKAEQIPAFLIKGEPLEQIFRKPLEYVSMRDQYINHRNYFLSRYNESILAVDLGTFTQRYAEANKKFFGKAKALEEVTSALQQYVKYPVSQEQLAAISAEVGQYRQMTANYESVKATLPEYWNAYLNDSTSIEQLNVLQSEWENQLSGIERYSEQLSRLKENGNYSECIEKANKVISARHVMLEKEQVIKDLLKLSIKDNEADWIGGKKELIKLLDEHFNELRDWITYRGVKAECEERGLQDICRLYEEGLEHDELIPVFFKSVYKALIF